MQCIKINKNEISCVEPRERLYVRNLAVGVVTRGQFSDLSNKNAPYFIIIIIILFVKMVQTRVLRFMSEEEEVFCSLLVNKKMY